MRKSKKILAASGLFLSAIAISSLTYSASSIKLENAKNAEYHSHFKTLESSKRTVNYSGIAGMWNNSTFPETPGYYHIIIQFGTFGVDFLRDDHTADATNFAKPTYDIGNKLTINGLPIHKLASLYPSVSVDYMHGNNYLHVAYPQEVLLSNKNNIVPTLHIEAGTEFEDVLLNEVNLKLIGDKWVATDKADFKIENPTDFKPYLDVELPHHFGTAPHPLFVQLPAEGANIAFNFNTGDLDPTVSDSVINFDNLYNTTVSIYYNAGLIALIDKTNGAVVDQFANFKFIPQTTYRFEFAVECGTTTSMKFAIDHSLILDYTFNYDKTGACDTWVVDTSGSATMDIYEELPSYQPSIIHGGSVSYDFIAGDPTYNFAGVVNAFDLYDDSVGVDNLSYEYEEGAVTDGRYNEGNWTLTIRLNLADGSSVTKEVKINVHGNTSVAKIYYGDAEPIEAPLGSKLVPPANPKGYREGEYDYIFDGWFFEGARWDFENDVVQGDMHLEARFRAVPIHYVVTVTFEGIDRKEETYSLTSGNSLPFVLFEEDGASYEVYKDGQKISSLVVTEDVELVVKYTVVYSFVEAKEATCTEDGNEAYWYSDVYKGYYFADSNGRELISNPIISKLNHNLIHLDYKDSTCYEVGNYECCYCSNCEKHYVDMDAQTEMVDWAIEKKAHVVSHHNEVAPTCENDGHVEYYSCANEPNTYYADLDCTIKLDSIVLDALGHDYRGATYSWTETANGYECKASIGCTHCNNVIEETKTAEKVVVREASCAREGQISYSVKFDNEKFNAQIKIVTVAKLEHNYIHIDAVAATDKHDGVKEHYECSSCHKYFLKSGSTYNEVPYIDLLVKYNPSKSGCGGNIATSSIVLSVTAAAFIAVTMIKRKKER